MQTVAWGAEVFDGAIEVTELVPACGPWADAAPPQAPSPNASVQQWLAAAFAASRIEPARARAAGGTRVAAVGGARGFYWWMLVLALAAFTLA